MQPLCVYKQNPETQNAVDILNNEMQLWHSLPSYSFMSFDLSIHFLTLIIVLRVMGSWCPLQLTLDERLCSHCSCCQTITDRCDQYHLILMTFQILGLPRILFLSETPGQSGILFICYITLRQSHRPNQNRNQIERQGREANYMAQIHLMMC